MKDKCVWVSHVCVCECACVCACVCGCVRACMSVSVCVNNLCPVPFSSRCAGHQGGHLQGAREHGAGEGVNNKHVGNNSRHVDLSLI